jgi:hypothetical protein
VPRRRLLAVETDGAHQQPLTAALVRAGYDVDTVPHDSALGHISGADMDGYGAVLIAMSERPSTLSESYRLGEYVLHYITQTSPHILPHVIAVTPAIHLLRTTEAHVLAEPWQEEQLLELVARAIGEQR